MTAIRVLIVDDHPVIRAGLRMLVDSQGDMVVADEAGDAQTALLKARDLRPDVITLDLNMPGTSSLEIIPLLAAELPGTRVLVLTMHDEPTYLRAVLQAGSSGFIVKTAGATELLAAIRAVHQGRIIVDSRNTVGLQPPAPGAESPGAPPDSDRLSRREREVLTLLARGQTNREVADSLELSEKTVETYKARIVEKLGLRSRSEIFQYAVKHRLIDGLN